MATKAQFNVNVVGESNSNTQVVIAAGQTLSTALSCGGTSPMGIFLPQNWTAGNVGFLVSKDGVNFYTLTNIDGTLYVAASNTTQFLPLPPFLFSSVLFIKVSCSVAQATSATLDFALAPIYKGLN